jgi:hypothetical protein
MSILLPPLHFSIPGESSDIPARIDFNPKLEIIHVCINDTPRTFKSMRQMYNYFLLLYGHAQAMEVVSLMAKHARKCQKIG